jgi:hypothetical protein
VKEAKMFLNFLTLKFQQQQQQKGPFFLISITRGCHFECASSADLAKKAVTTT